MWSIHFLWSSKTFSSFISESKKPIFSNINLGQNINENDLNKILKNLYNTNFFKNVSVNFKQNLLSVVVEEYPIIQEIIYKGIKSKNLKEKITSNVKLINRSSYNEIFLKQDKNLMLSKLKEEGYYFSEIEIDISEKENNKISWRARK